MYIWVYSHWNVTLSHNNGAQKLNKLCANGVWALNRVLWALVTDERTHNANLTANASASWTINEIFESNMNVFLGSTQGLSLDCNSIRIYTEIVFNVLLWTFARSLCLNFYAIEFGQLVILKQNKSTIIFMMKSYM